MLIFILLIIGGIALFIGTAQERQVMRDCDKISKENEKTMWKEINKSNEEWRNSHK